MDDRGSIEQVKGFLGEYLQQRGLSLRKPFRCLNPGHADVHPSMSYHGRNNNVHCFSCGVTYDLIDLVGMDYGLSGFGERLRKACELFGVDSSPASVERGRRKGAETTAAAADRRVELEAIRQKATADLSYFLSRGITEESCREHGLFRQGDRAYFPVVEGGVCTGWCARAVDDAVSPRYKNSVGSLGLWNGGLLREEGRGRPLFITEGIVDAILLQQLGKCAVALCGSQNAGKLLSRLEQGHRAACGWSFVACGDPDEAGDKMNAALLEGLARLGLEGRILPLEAGGGDIAELYGNHREKLLDKLAEASESVSCESTSTAACLDRFFEEVGGRAQQRAVSTGFRNLDKLLDGGLYPGLYVIGAISSLGKTSFALQMADFIAESAADVLFFTMEQSRMELMAKSLSRLSAQLSGYPYKQAYTARQLLSGQLAGPPQRQLLLQETKEEYRAVGGLFLKEGMADIGVEEIRRTVKDHKNQRGSAPVVVVDYLQILRGADPRVSDKQNMDRAVVELKRLSRDFEIPVIAISSFNRENYRAAVSMEAFKESGAIEYSSDVLLGLQLVGAGTKDFDQNSEKVKEPRQVELVLLKNRNGIPFAKVKFRYYARFNLFLEAGGSRAVEKS